MILLICNISCSAAMTGGRSYPAFFQAKSPIGTVTKYPCKRNFVPTNIDDKCTCTEDSCLCIDWVCNSYLSQEVFERVVTMDPKTVADLLENKLDISCHELSLISHGDKHMLIWSTETILDIAMEQVAKVHWEIGSVIS